MRLRLRSLTRSARRHTRRVRWQQYNGRKSLSFYDEPLSTLVVHKYVKGTDNETLSGVTFKVVDGTGKNVGNSDGLFVTDANGDIMIPDLELGTVLKVREVKTVDGYVLNGTPHSVFCQGDK